jgi:uncharacterized membrane protein
MKLKLAALRLLTVFALGVCGAVLGEYLFGASDLCLFNGTCQSVIHSEAGRPLGVPLPVIGLAGFGLLLGLLLFPERRSFVLVGPLALLAGVAGLTLVLVQYLVLKQFCSMCLFVDGSAIALAFIVLVGMPRPGALPATPWWQRAAWLAGAVLAVVLPPLYVWTGSNPPVPEQVKALWVEDRLTVVELMDFECQRCRDAESILADFLRKKEKEGEKIHFVRLSAPMPNHEHARDSARAYLAAEAQDKGEAMKDALIASLKRDEAECRKLAKEIGLDLAAYDRVVKDPATDKKLDDTNAWGRTAGPGLPLLWVGDQLVTPPVSRDKLEIAYRKAQRSAKGGK